MSKITICELQSTDKVPWSLFLLADPSEKMIKKYFPKGKCFIAISDDQIIGEYVVLSKENSIWELMNIAVKEEFQGKGIGKELLKHAIETARNLGGKTLEVGTGNSSIDQLHFYQKNGFHIVGFEKDFFINNYTEPIIENGIACKDKIILAMSL